MPELVWNEAEFEAYLEVLPDVDESDIARHFKVLKDGLRLNLSVHTFVGDIHITLYRDGVERPLLDVRITQCRSARYVNDIQGEYLEFASSQIWGVRLSVKPSIQIKLFGT